MGKRKRIAVVFLIVLLMGVLAGCGQKEYKVEYGIDGYVYMSRKLQSMDDVEELRVIGDYLYYMQNTGSSTAIARVSVASLAAGEGGLDFSGKETVAQFKNITFELPEGSGENGEDIDFLSALDGSIKQSNGIKMEQRYGRLVLERYAVAPDGTLYFYLQAYAGEYFSPNFAGGVLCRQTPEGEQNYRVYIPEMLDFAVDMEGRGIILTGNGIQVLDPEGNQTGFVSTEEYHMNAKAIREELFTDSEGRVYYNVVNDKYVRTAYEITGEGNFRLEKDEGFPGDGLKNYSAASEGNVFLYAPSTKAVLYLYDREAGSERQLLNWWESGLMSSGIQSVAGITQDVLLVSYLGIFGGESGIYQLTRTPVEELPERELIVIAAPGSSFELQKAVMMFNAKSNTYRVVLESYGAEYTNEEGWVCPQLDASLVSANPPDILDLSTLNIVKYARKGVLEDLTPYLEGSSQDIEDIPDNILEGLTFDGRLVSIPLTFDIYYIGARAAQVKDFESWSMEDVYRLAEMHPESIGGMIGDSHGRRAKRDWLLSEFCARYYLEKFIDWEKWECSFDNEEFRSLIAWAGKYGWEPEHEEVQMGTIFLEEINIPDDVLLVSDYRIRFATLAQLELQYGEEVCLKGYPTADGRGTFPARVDGGLGINVNSSHKEAAWEFIEYYLQVNGGTGISKTQIKKLYENDTTPTYIEGTEGEDGEPEMKVKSYLYLGSDYIPYYVIEKEQADAILNAIETADFTPMSEEEEMIVKIVVEEAASYFNGDKSLEEVTGIIQNRAQLLLKERKE